MIADEFDKDEIRVIAPGRRKCPQCADRHGPHEPHNKNSLYYRAQFYQKHGRFPTWEDAMEGLSQMMTAYWRGEMRKKGVDAKGGGSGRKP